MSTILTAVLFTCADWLQPQNFATTRSLKRRYPREARIQAGRRRRQPQQSQGLDRVLHGRGTGGSMAPGMDVLHGTLDAYDRLEPAPSQPAARRFVSAPARLEV